MSEPTGKTFACPRCGNQFALKPGMAGKKISCTCGRIFDVGSTGGGIYETVGVKREAAAIEDRAALYPKRTSAIKTEGPSREGETPFSLMKDRILPIALIVMGLSGRVAQAIFVSSRTHHPAASTAMVAFDLIAGIAVALLGGYFAAAMLAIDFGHLGTAAMKLTAVAVFNGAAAAWVPYIDYDPARIRGTLMALELAILIYFALFYAIFELDLQEAMMTTLIVGVIEGLVLVGMHAAG